MPSIRRSQKGMPHCDERLQAKTGLGQVQANFGALTKLVAGSPVPSRADVRSLIIPFWRAGYALTGAWGG